MSTEPQLPRLNERSKETIMNLQSKHGDGRVRSGWTLLALALAVLLPSLPATAQRMHRSNPSQSHESHESHESHGNVSGLHRFNRGPGSFPGFHQHNGGMLRGGHFIHGRHQGRLGWWWVDGGLWYWYPATVYAYPYAYPYPDEPAAAAASPPPDVGPAVQYWLFCEASGAYYPYVTTCPGGWKQVQQTLNDASPVPVQ